jgi:hypothetical protein
VPRAYSKPPRRGDERTVPSAQADPPSLGPEQPLGSRRRLLGMRDLVVGVAAMLATWTCVGCGLLGNDEPIQSPLPSSGRASDGVVESDAPRAGGKSLVLGPRGVGRLRLGMTHQEVADTGAARDRLGSRHDGWPHGCRVLQYRLDQLGRPPGNTVNGALSPRQGIEVMYATPRMVTPEGVRLGSTARAVREAYHRPGVRIGDQVIVRASRQAVYRIQVGLGGRITSISLELRRLDCTI